MIGLTIIKIWRKISLENFKAPYCKVNESQNRRCSTTMTILSSDDEKVVNLDSGNDQDYKKPYLIAFKQAGKEIMEKQSMTSMEKIKSQKNKRTKNEKETKKLKMTNKGRKKQNKDILSSSDDDGEEVEWDDNSAPDYNDYCKNVLYEAEREVLDDLETFDVEDESVANKDNNNVEEDYEDYEYYQVSDRSMAFGQICYKKNL